MSKKIDAFLRGVGDVFTLAPPDPLGPIDFRGIPSNNAALRKDFVQIDSDVVHAVREVVEDIKASGREKRAKATAC